jgi:hypothetical protein
MNELSEVQSEVVAKLEKRGFRVNDTRHFEGDTFATVFMSKRVKSYSTHYAEVDGAGWVNGKHLDDFILG